MNDLYSIRDMARLYDIYDILHLNGRRKQIVCPLPQHVHHHRTPSFSIFNSNTGRQKWVCHGNCQQSGDSIDIMGFMHIPGYDKKNGEHVRQALALLSGGTQINPPQIETTKAATLPNGLYRRYLPAGDAVVNYAGERGLTRETLAKFDVGQDDYWMTMPAIHGGQLRGIKKRNTRKNCEKHSRFRAVDGSIDGLFGYNLVNSTTQAVAIVKGEIPVMLLSQFGILAAAPTGGESSYYKHEELLYPLAFASKRIVIGDNDPDPGVRANMTLAARRRAEIFRADIFFPPNPFTGVDDWLRAKPEEALPAIRTWLAF